MEIKENEVSLEQWDQKWKKDQAFWHRNEPHELLVKYYDDLVNDQTKRIFLPLCGKSLDLFWLAKRKLEVVGVEYSEMATKAVFEEENCSYTVQKEGKFEVYRANEFPLTVFRGDFFDISEKIVGTFDAIWDRGGFTAIVSKSRPKYAEVICSLLNVGAKCLLFSSNYFSELYGGPPYPASQEQIEGYYNKFCSIKHLEDMISPRPKFHTDEYTATMNLILKL